MSDRPVTLNLGAGVQSSALLLMAALGEIGPMPEVAVFADTGDEPEKVYEHVAWLEQTVTALTLGRLRIVRTSAGNLGDGLIAAARGRAKRASNPPVFTVTEHGPGRALRDGKVGRNCTRDFKVRPIRKALRDLGYGPKHPVTTWLGISFDEVERIKPSDVAWQELAHPLADLGISRADCERWTAEHGFPPAPRSACVYCPLHGREEWRNVRANPRDWARAVEVDEALRGGLPGMRGTVYVHRDRIPLADVDLDTLEDAGQLSLVADECEGFCHT